ncbi:Uncharacterised protein [Segatella copri]|nr:Uncharacterised protein [Segatella copri]
MKEDILILFRALRFAPEVVTLLECHNQGERNQH